MSLLVWIVIGLVVLAIIGLGVGTFFSGVKEGANTISQNPAVQNITKQAKGFVDNSTKTLAEKKPAWAAR
ncbi:MAG: hypothetical protein ABI347_02320 [Nitrososphaera sp.]|jgi:uncharacterized protein YneF (UPF0154 family)